MQQFRLAEFSKNSVTFQSLVETGVANGSGIKLPSLTGICDTKSDWRKHRKETVDKLRHWITVVSKAPLPQHSKRAWTTAKNVAKAEGTADFPEYAPWREAMA